MAIEFSLRVGVDTRAPSPLNADGDLNGSLIKVKIS